jgi:hypothetical protein
MVYTTGKNIASPFINILVEHLTKIIVFIYEMTRNNSNSNADCQRQNSETEAEISKE